MIADILAFYRLTPEPGQTVFDLRLEEQACMRIVLSTGVEPTWRQ